MIKKISIYFNNGTVLHLDGPEPCRVDPNVGTLMTKTEDGKEYFFMLTSIKYWEVTLNPQNMVTQ